MSGDSAGAAVDLADALEAFADRAGAPGSPREVWVTIGTPHDIEQRTVQLPADLADWISELVRDEVRTLEAGSDADHDLYGYDDSVGSEDWWG
ncbi:hypothetical protein ACGFZP_21985 [Kitasatospora sp. NPDC048239]|uniref:hypothetical protein n=1 Tax=Kitasatospora sp. NPDC048239 TaxID=3364046 RepID=UPI00371E0CE9